MATAVQKIALNTARDIPFNKLILSQANVRRVKAGVSIEELAESIARRGLIQSLNVRPVLDAEGLETGMFEVPAGGRRYRALELLAKQKRVTKAQPVPCVVRPADANTTPEEDSLEENEQRAPLHPLDQFRAFQTLRMKGLDEDEIAVARNVSVQVVKQRLRLASVSPKLHDVYAEDGMSLEQLMAFSVTGDHARQEQVWESLSKTYYKEPYQIRRALTESSVRASDRRVQFVGLAAYEEAGGVILRDLFQGDDGGWLQDVGLVDMLVAEKLRESAEAIGAEGWKWVEAATDFSYGHTADLRRLSGIAPRLSDEEQATRNALAEELDRLYAEHEGDEDLPDEVDARLAELETAIQEFDSRPTLYDAAEVARAGAFVSVDGSGNLRVDRGYVRAEDEAPVIEGSDGDEIDVTDADGPDGSETTTPSVQRAVITIGGQAEPEEDEDDVIRPLPDRLVTELTAHRTLALRDAVASNPHVAMTALLHKLVLDTFQHSSSTGCLEASVRHVFFPVQSADLKDSASAAAIAERQEAWNVDLPTEDDALWNRLAALDDASRTALLAHCVAYGVNALYEKVDRYGSGLSQHGLDRRLAQADRLAHAVGLDMVDAGWRPTVDNYLGRVTKPRILEAVREAKGEQAAQLIDHLKKGDMAKEAERLLDGTGWLPEPLRNAAFTPDSDVATTDEEGAEVESLPAFLDDDDQEDADAELDEPTCDLDTEPHAIAAE